MAVKLISREIGYLQTNCYLAVCSQTGQSLVIDPGIYCDELEEMLKSVNVEKLDYIILTHGHFDHILGAKMLKDNYGGKIVIHEIDEECFTNPNMSLLSRFPFKTQIPEKADITVTDGDKIPFANSFIEVIHTPGHTKGGMTLRFENMLFTGDTLFKGSVGRSDFYGGDQKTLLESVKKLTKLSGNYIIYPGHGESSTLDEERQNNPYVTIR